MEVTKESLEIFTEATIKSATEMEKIVGALHAIISKQDQIVDRLMNGMAQEIIDGVVSNYNSVHKETIDCLRNLSECTKEVKNNMPIIMEDKVSNSTIAKDIEHVKWFVAIVGIAIIVATVVLRGMETRAIVTAEVKTIQKAIIAELKK